jgi:hypothetical protein
MSWSKSWAIAGMVLALGIQSAYAEMQAPPPQKPVALSKDGQAEALKNLKKLVEANYVFPDVARKITSGLVEKERQGRFASANDVKSFSKALTETLRELSDDRHFRVAYDPEFKTDTVNLEVIPSEDMAKMRAETKMMAYGIERVQRLPGNVGLIELRGFGPTELVGPAFDAAMALLDGSAGLIVDLRRNGGGDPSSVAYFMSHFFPSGDEKHLNDLYDKVSNTTRQYWTNSGVSQRYDKPVYILTSPRTFSAGEECAYDFQTQKRGVIVGETSGGGANPVNTYALGSGLTVNLPTGRAINPITHTNWEHIGVKPDIATTAADAENRAYLEILRKQLATNQDPEIHEDLLRVLSFVEKGERMPMRFSNPN